MELNTSLIWPPKDQDDVNAEVDVRCDAFKNIVRAMGSVPIVALDCTELEDMQEMC